MWSSAALTSLSGCTRPLQRMPSPKSSMKQSEDWAAFGFIGEILPWADN